MRWRFLTKTRSAQRSPTYFCTPLCSLCLCVSDLSFPSIGKVAVVLVGEDLSGFVKIAGAGVVGEPFPCLEHVGLQCCRESLPRRELLHPAVVIINHRVHPCLLQHDFGNPHAVRRAVAPPRQVAAVRRKPRQKPFFNRRCDDTGFLLMRFDCIHGWARIRQKLGEMQR